MLNVSTVLRAQFCKCGGLAFTIHKEASNCVENNGLPGIVTSCCVDKAKGVFQFPRVTNSTAKLKNGYFSQDESPL